MGKKCQKGQQGFTKGSKSNHSYHSLDRRSRVKSTKSPIAAPAIADELEPTSIPLHMEMNFHPPIVDKSAAAANKLLGGGPNEGDRGSRVF